MWYSMNKLGLVKISLIPVWIIRLKFIQFPGPVSSLSVIMFWHSALIQVPGLIGHSITVHTPPGKQPQLISHDDDREITRLPAVRTAANGCLQGLRGSHSLFFTSHSPCQTHFWGGTFGSPSLAFSTSPSPPESSVCYVHEPKTHTHKKKKYGIAFMCYICLRND